MLATSSSHYFYCFFFKMNQHSSKVKTFVEGQESMLESLDEMIERYSQEQVSECLQANLWSIVKFNESISCTKMSFFLVFCNNLSALFIIVSYICY